MKRKKNTSNQHGFWVCICVCTCQGAFTATNYRGRRKRGRNVAMTEMEAASIHCFPSTKRALEMFSTVSAQLLFQFQANRLTSQWKIFSIIIFLKQNTLLRFFFLNQEMNEINECKHYFCCTGHANMYSSLKV